MRVFVRGYGQSIGSRSGSGNQTGEVARPQSRGVEAADNPIGSNDGNGSSDGSDNGSSRLNAQGGSDNGSGNQVQAFVILVLLGIRRCFTVSRKYWSQSAVSFLNMRL